MRPIRVAAGLIVAISAVLFVAPFGRAEEPKPATTPAAEQLSDRVAELERKVEQLERANAELKKQFARKERELARRHVAETLVIPPQELRAAPAVPDHWIPREFNGDTFYLIPLKQGGN